MSYIQTAPHRGGARSAGALEAVHCRNCPLREPRCVAGVAAARRDEFARLAVSGHYRRRHVIFHEGMPTTGLYVLCRGAVKLYQTTASGREQILGVAVPGDVLGEVLLDPRDAYSESAEALTDAQLCYLPREKLVAFIRTHPMTSVLLIAALSKTLSAVHKKICALAQKGAVNRLAELLLDLTRAVGSSTASIPGPMTLSYTRREIAEMIGVSPETVIRLLGKLKQKNAITCRRRALVITDPEKLALVAAQSSPQTA